MTRAVLWAVVPLFFAGCSKRDTSQARAFEAARRDLWDKVDDLMTAIDTSPGGAMGSVPNAQEDEQNHAAGVKLAAASQQVVLAARKIPHIKADGDLARCVENTLEAVGFFEKSLGPIAKQYESDPQDASLTGSLEEDEFKRSVCKFLQDEACKTALQTSNPLNEGCR